MFRLPSLSPEHYAYRWRMPTEDTLNDRDRVNQLAIRYASLPDGIEREEVLLDIVQCFHGYLIKYLNMIVRGHLPPMKSPAGKEAAVFLKTLIPKTASQDSQPGHLTLTNVCRTLHLAFKQQSSDDIYDVLALCLIRTVKKYDPFYTNKVKKVCEVIDEKCAGKRRRGVKPEFTTDDIRGEVDFECLGCLRLLVRKKFLASVTGPKKKVVGYRRTTEWPPPAKFFQSGPIGFVYFLPLYFRYYLHEQISGAMSEIESKEHVLQLDHRHGGDESGSGSTSSLGTPNRDGQFTDTEGVTWSADTTLMNLPLDVSSMTPKWVKSTKDKLFRKLTVRERHLLYMVFVQEYKWVEIASVLDCDTTTARKQFDMVMNYLRARAGTTEEVEPLKDS